MGSKYQEFTDDVISVDNKTADDHCSCFPVDTSSSSAAATAAAVAAGGSVSNIQTSVPLSISASNQPVIIVQAPKLQRSFERYPSKAAVIFGAIQVSAGCASFILGIANAVTCASYGVLGFGLWCGVLFIIAGSFGIFSSKRKTTCMIVTHMVLSVISAVASSVQLSLAVAAAAWDVYDLDYFGCYYFVGPYRPGSRVDPAGAVATSSLLAVCAIVEGVVAILGSAISCKVVCCSAAFTAASSGPVMNGASVYFVSSVCTPPGSDSNAPVNPLPGNGHLQ